MFHICVQSQSWNLSNSPNYTCHSRILIFLFFFTVSCSGVIVYLGHHGVVSTVGLGDSNFFSTDLPFFPFYLTPSNPLPQNLLLSGLGWTSHRWGISVPIHTILLMIHCLGVDYLVPLNGGIAACFGGAFSSGFFVIIKAGAGTSFPFGGIGHDLATNK